MIIINIRRTPDRYQPRNRDDRMDADKFGIKIPMRRKDPLQCRTYNPLLRASYLKLSSLLRRRSGTASIILGYGHDNHDERVKALALVGKSLWDLRWARMSSNNGYRQGINVCDEILDYINRRVLGVFHKVKIKNRELRREYVAHRLRADISLGFVTANERQCMALSCCDKLILEVLQSLEDDPKLAGRLNLNQSNTSLTDDVGQRLILLAIQLSILHPNISLAELEYRAEKLYREAIRIVPKQQLIGIGTRYLADATDDGIAQYMHDTSTMLSNFGVTLPG